MSGSVTDEEERVGVLGVCKFGWCVDGSCASCNFFEIVVSYDFLKGSTFLEDSSEDESLDESVEKVFMCTERACACGLCEVSKACGCVLVGGHTMRPCWFHKNMLDRIAYVDCDMMGRPVHK